MKTPVLLRAVLVCFPLLFGRPAFAEVVSASAAGFVTRAAVDVAASPLAAYEAILRIAGWWSKDHTFSGDAGNLSLEARLGGCFCEKLAEGGFVRHLQVVYVAPGKQLRLEGGLGPLQALGVSGDLTFTLAAREGGASVELVYRVSGYDPGGLDKIAPAVDGVLSQQLSRLKRFVETGTPSAP